MCGLGKGEGGRGRWRDVRIQTGQVWARDGGRGAGASCPLHQAPVWVQRGGSALQHARGWPAPQAPSQMRCPPPRTPSFGDQGFREPYTLMKPQVALQRSVHLSSPKVANLAPSLLTSMECAQVLALASVYRSGGDEAAGRQGSAEGGSLAGHLPRPASGLGPPAVCAGASNPGARVPGAGAPADGRRVGGGARPCSRAERARQRAGGRAGARHTCRPHPCPA